MFRRASLVPILLALLLAVFFAGCGSKQNSTNIDYQIGDRITVAPLTYNVVETVWRSQLGEVFRIRVPQQRFLLITISVTNGGGGEVSVPLLQLTDQAGTVYRESENGEGVDNWFGLLRTLSPAQTQQGRIVFDVPLRSYRLRLPDGGDPSSEKAAFVQIPLRIDADAPVEAPIPGKQ